MPTSVRELADITGYSRDAITTRVRRFGLDPKNFDPREILDLKPLKKTDDKETLEQARTRLAQRQAQKLDIEIETLEGNRLPTTQITGAVDPVLTALRTDIDNLPFDQDAKNEWIDRLADLPRRIFGDKSEE